MQPSENIMMRKLCRFEIIKVEDQALCQASGEDQDSKSHPPSTPTTSLCLRLVSDSNPHQCLTLLLPKVVGWKRLQKQWGCLIPCFVQKAKTQGVAYPNSGTSSTLWKRILHLQLPVDPWTWGESQHALPHRGAGLNWRVSVGALPWIWNVQLAEPCSNWRLNARLSLSKHVKYLLIGQITETETTQWLQGGEPLLQACPREVQHPNI